MRKFTPSETNHLIKHGKDPFVKTDSEMPVEYMTNKAEFYGRDFNVTPDTLIPRIETEEIIDLALKQVDSRANKYSKVTYCDVGTGTGAIGITLALELEKRLIPYNAYISDISKEALQIAEGNAHEFLIERKIHCFINQKDESTLQLINSDLLSDYPQVKFDLIIANLPYIPSSRISKLDSSVKDFEPTLALDGGIDGLEYIRKLLEQSKKFLNDNGSVILEVDDTHTIEHASKFQDWEIELIKDQNDKNRFWRIKPKGQ